VTLRVLKTRGCVEWTTFGRKPEYQACDANVI
jgi:hypothetical protein